jgi:hypothetical protein
MTLLSKWSDHCDDVCPHCDEHTGIFAPTYRWNQLAMVCPRCFETAISGFDIATGTFRWFKIGE